MLVNSIYMIYDKKKLLNIKNNNFLKFYNFIAYY